MISNDAEYKPEEVFEVLQRVIRLAIDPKEFTYLTQGIGTSTERGKALLDALAVIKKYGDQR